MRRLSSEHQIARVRGICLAFPGATEKISHGEPTWFVKKVFCMFANNHHGDGRVAVWLPAARGVQESLVEASPRKFFRPPYVGPKGWVGVELGRVSDKELSAHIEAAWRLVAPGKLVAELDGD